MVKKIQGAIGSGTTPAGRFCWTDLGAGKPTESQAFYGTVLGWQCRSIPLPSGGDYTLLRVDGQDAAGLYELSDDQKAQKIPPHWLVYLAVDDAAEAAAKAKSLGGSIVVDAYDVLELGRMAILLDPTGAMFAVWEAGSRKGMQVTAGEPGSLCWCELMTPNLDVAAHFYAELFGWTVEIQEAGAMRHARCHKDGTPIADIMGIGAGHGRVPPHWLAYFSVTDCETANTAVTTAGGRTLVAPSPLAEGNMFAIVRDPEGAIFGLMSDET